VASDTESLPSTADAVVIGAGLAGLSAAVRLAGAGHRVVVLEEAPRLGGRAASFTDKETGERVDNGQHVLFGCYRHTYAFLKHIGTVDRAPLQPRLSLTMASPQGKHARLVCPSLPAPWHLAAGLLRWRALDLADRLSALRLSGLLQDVRRRGAAAVADEVRPEQTVSSWLDEHRQTRRLRDWLWDPLAYAALNQSPDAAAAAPFVRVLGELFGPHRDNAAIGLPTVPLEDLFGYPAAAFIEAAGGVVRTRRAARIVRDDNGAIAHVRAGDSTIRTAVVVGAVPWHAFGRLWEDSVPAPLSAIADRAAAMGSAPIVTVNLWLDANVMTEPFMGLVNSPMHWVFDKRAILRERAAHLSMVASGAEDIARLDNSSLTDLAFGHLRRALPAASARRVVRSVVVREHRATFSLSPGQPTRPGTLTPLGGFYLAGDWTDTGLPGTIEGAVMSGHSAADAVLARTRPPHRMQ